MDDLPQDSERRKPDAYTRQRYFPQAVESTRHKLKRLEAEARATRSHDILRCLEAANRAWDREIEIARLLAGREE